MAKVSEIKTVGFVGLGTMGLSMAKNLVKGGFQVQGFDIAAPAMAALAEAGGQVAATPRAAGEGADMVMLMLPNSPHIRTALEGADGILSVVGDGRPIVNSSTIDPTDALDLRDLAIAAGWHYVDAPVGRTAAHAAAGQCLFMLGGEAEDKAGVRPALEAMGDSFVDCGAVGHGSTVKIVNNYLSVVASVLTSEALCLAEAGGVAPAAALAIVNETTAMNGHTKNIFPAKVLAGDVEPGFPVEHAAKDLGIALGALERAGIPSFVGPGARVAYEAAHQQGRDRNDWSDIYNAVATLWKDRQGR